MLAGLLRKDIEPDTTQQGRKFDIRHCFADIERARETLGYAPVVSLEEGMAELIKWAAANEDTAVDKLDFALEELRRNNLLAE